MTGEFPALDLRETASVSEAAPSGNSTAGTTYFDPTDTYGVPERFGIAAMLGVMTLFSFVFAILHQFGAPMVLYLFFGSLGSVIALAQMRSGAVPRTASVIAGAVFLPLWAIVGLYLDGGRNWICMGVGTLPLTIGCGAATGYLAGAIMAGVFLVIDLFEKKGPPPRPLPGSPADRASIRNRFRQTAQMASEPRSFRTRQPAHPSAAQMVEERFIQCGVCGEANRQSLLIHTAEQGGVDLESRSVGPQRTTLPLWIQTCPHCGCCGDDLADPLPIAHQRVAEDAYRRQLHHEAYPPLSNQFLCLSMLHEWSGDLAAAGWRSLHAAWACDDAYLNDPSQVRHQQSACHCRRRAATFFQGALALNQTVLSHSNAVDPLLANIYRRAGLFEEAQQAILRGTSSLSEQDRSAAMLLRILEFLQDRVQAGDDAPYGVADVVNS